MDSDLKGKKTCSRIQASRIMMMTKGTIRDIQVAKLIW